MIFFGVLVLCFAPTYSAFWHQNPEHAPRSQKKRTGKITGLDCLSVWLPGQMFSTLLLAWCRHIVSSLSIRSSNLCLWITPSKFILLCPIAFFPLRNNSIDPAPYSPFPSLPTRNQTKWRVRLCFSCLEPKVGERRRNQLHLCRKTRERTKNNGKQNNR